MADGGKIDVGIREADSCLEPLVREPVVEGSGLSVADEKERECKTLENVGCSIEEDLGKVSLVGGDSVSVDGNISTKSEVADVEICEADSRLDVLAQEPIGEVSELSVPNVEERECETLENASFLIEEDLGKVSLVGENGNSVSIDENATTKNEVADVNGAEEETMNAKEESGSSESESATTSSASSSASSSSSSDSSSDDDSDESDSDVNAEKKNASKVVKAKMKVNEAGEVEEGEIRDATNDNEEVDAMVGWSDDDDLEEGGVVKPIRSKNEVKDLPHVPLVDASLLPHHQMTPVGIVQSVLGTQVIVEGIEKHSPLNDGSILWITETRSPLGFVDEIFGPVKNPYYIVRFNSEAEVPLGISTNTLVSFVPEFADHVLNNNDIYKKGYDASGANDEELSDEDDFSDDEKEAEHRRMLKMAKRGTNEQMPRDWKKKNNNNNKRNINKGEPWKNSQNSQPSPSLPTTVDHGNFSPSFNVGQGFTHGSGLPPQQPPPQLPPLAQAACFEASMNGVWPNGMPFHQPPGFFPNSFPANNMPWPMQNPHQYVYQMPMPNGIPFNPQVNPNQNQPFAGFPHPQGHHGPSNFNPTPFGVNVQGQQGVNPNGAVMGQSFNGPQHGGGNDSSAPQHFASGPSHGGRGSNHRGGGRFGHRGRGRGRRQ